MENEPVGPMDELGKAIASVASTAGASTVGWFALVLGVALVVVDLVQRAKGKRP